MKALLSKDNDVLLLDPPEGLLEILRGKGHDLRIAEVRQEWIIEEVGK